MVTPEVICLEVSTISLSNVLGVQRAGMKESCLRFLNVMLQIQTTRLNKLSSSEAFLFWVNLKYVLIHVANPHVLEHVCPSLRAVTFDMTMLFPALSQDQASKDKALQNMAALSSAQIVSPNLIKSQLPPLPQPPYPPPARVS